VSHGGYSGEQSLVSARWEGSQMSISRSFVRRDIRSQTRIPASVEEVVRQSKGGRAVEGEHSAIFGIVDGRRRGRGLLGGTGVHVLHRGDLINNRARVFASPGISMSKVRVSFRRRTRWNRELYYVSRA
jgi:hypothetical protein